MSKILFIQTEYFEYHKIIKKELESLGHEVDWFDDRPSTNLIIKGILRVKPSLLKKKIHNYFYKTIRKKVKENKYDIIFVIVGQSFNGQMFLDLKTLIPNSKFILYLWDSVATFGNLVDLSRAFDITYSFDKEDCKNYGFKFLPLFYAHQIEQVRNFKIDQFDCSYIGTIKKGKLPFINKLKKQLDERFYRNFYYLYLQSRLVYLFNKFFDKDFKKVRISLFKFKKLDYIKTLEILNNSKIVIDIPMKNQVGLPMRVFESLALGCKLITTNKDIVNYDFYKPENIYVYDGKNIDFNNIFFKTEFTKSDVNFDKYSIKNRLITIMEMENTNL